jgi:predicted transcriptional regulator
MIYYVSTGKMKKNVVGGFMVDLPVLRDYIKREAKNATYEQLGKRFGLHYRTVFEIAKGKQTNPRYSTMKAIERAMMEDINGR